MSRRPWTTTDLAVLRDNAGLGVAALSELLRRSPSSVKLFAYRNGISLRRRRCLCPACGCFFVALSSHSGFCRVCEVRAQAAQRRCELAAIEHRLHEREHRAVLAAESELATVRQQVHRAQLAVTERVPSEPWTTRRTS